MKDFEICKLPSGFVMTKKSIRVIEQLFIDRNIYGQCISFIKDGKIIRVPPEDWHKNAT